jgi:hypothetical protein
MKKTAILWLSNLRIAAFRRAVLGAGVCAALWITACAGLPPGSADTGEAVVPPAEQPGAPVAGERPEKSPFTEQPPETLPPEARSYLRALSAAFRNHDRDFLAAQGEKSFEAEVRPGCDEETYLALLYRIGPYGTEDPGADTRVPRLFPEEIDGLEYAGWEEQGPHLEIRGRLIRRGQPPLPCLIMLVWKLREPKILGRFP